MHVRKSFCYVRDIILLLFASYDDDRTFLPTWSFNANFVILQNVGPAFQRPCGILR
jgi:hypothetical protein